MKVDVLAFGAHPDDVELGCGGTISKLVKQGKKVAIVDLTRGELGTRGTDQTRAVEAKEAGEILGISARRNLGMPDGYLLNIEANQLEIVKMLRLFQPEIVLANAIDDRHPDHAKGAKLVSDACFLSGLVKVETLFETKTQEPWRPKHVFNYIQWKEIKPDFVVDVSEHMEAKIEACLAYKTQFFDPNSKEPMTPIATKDFLESLSYRAQNLGRLSGCDFAEGFTSDKLLALKNFENIVL